MYLAKNVNLPQSAFHTEPKNNLDEQLQVASKHEIINKGTIESIPDIARSLSQNVIAAVV